MTIFTIDVSHHDDDRHGGPLDWAKIHASGIDAMCTKVTEADPGGSYHYADPSGPRNVANARAAGLALTGVYHCLSHGDSACIARQVDWLAKMLEQTGAAWAMIDVEPFDELTSRGIAPKIGDVNAFCDRWAAVTGKPLAVYLPKWYWSQLGSPSLSHVKVLVSSDYGANADGTPQVIYTSRGGDTGRGLGAYGGVTPALWQFSSNSNVPGASGQTDANAFRGTLEELAALLTGDDMTTEVNLYRGRTAPPAVAGKDSGVLMDDVWAQEILGHSAYDTDKSYRTKQLDQLVKDMAEVKKMLAELAAAPAVTGKVHVEGDLTVGPAAS